MVMLMLVAALVLDAGVGIVMIIVVAPGVAVAVAVAVEVIVIITAAVATKVGRRLRPQQHSRSSRRAARRPHRTEAPISNQSILVCLHATPLFIRPHSSSPTQLKTVGMPVRHVRRRETLPPMTAPPSASKS